MVIRQKQGRSRGSASADLRAGDEGESLATTARQGGAEAMRGIQAADELRSRSVENVARQAERMSRGAVDAVAVYGESMQSASERIRGLMTSSRAVSQGLIQAQRALTNWLGHSVQTNTRLTHDLLQCRSLHDIATIQSDFVRDSLDGAIRGSIEVLRNVTRVLDDAAEQIERQGQGGRAGQGRMTVGDVMETSVHLVRSDQPVQEVARIMSENDTGIVPVGENDRLVGMVTDRDIAIRVTAAGKDPGETTVRDIMTPEVRYLYEDEDVEHAAENMSEQQIRRLPVVDRDKRLVGIVALADLASELPPDLAGRALAGIVQAGPERQAANFSQAAGDKPRRDAE